MDRGPGLWLGVLVLACAGGAGYGAGGDEPVKLKGFSQEIPSAAYKIEMAPIPASEDGKIKAFWMSTTEVTWEAYDVFAYRMDEDESAPANESDAKTRPSKPYLPPDRGFGHEGYAAISLTHHAAKGFCAWLSKKSGKAFRLAREDEWEHACRAGAAGAKYSFGDDAGKLGDYAWFAGNGEGTPHPVGKKKPNAWGLFDMHGNVCEWVDGRDGKPITKGGSYREPAERVTIEARIAQDRTWNSTDPQLPKSTWWLSDGPFAGFRIVCEADGDKPAKAAEAGAKAPDARPGDAPAGETKKEDKK